MFHSFIFNCKSLPNWASSSLSSHADSNYALDSLPLSPFPSLVIRPYQPALFGGHPKCIQCLHRADEYIYSPLCNAGCDTRSILKRSLTGLNSDRLPYRSWRAQFALSRRKNSWIHIFPKVISPKLNANNPIQNLNSCCHVSFRRQ